MTCGTSHNLPSGGNSGFEINQIQIVCQKNANCLERVLNYVEMNYPFRNQFAFDSRVELLFKDFLPFASLPNFQRFSLKSQWSQFRFNVRSVAFPVWGMVAWNKLPPAWWAHLIGAVQDCSRAMFTFKHQLHKLHQDIKLYSDSGTTITRHWIHDSAHTSPSTISNGTKISATKSTKDPEVTIT